MALSADVCRVMIVDDHQVVRIGLASMVAADPAIEVVGEAGSVAEALDRLPAADPDVVLADLELSDGNGVDLIGRVKAVAPNCKGIVFSAHDPETFAVWAMRGGVDGYLDKITTPRAVCDAILEVWRGGQVFAHLRARHEAASDAPRGRGTDALSDREFEVLLLIGQGRNTKEIAGALGVSDKTIDNHKRAIRDKIGLADHDKLLRFASWACRVGPAGRGAAGEDRALVSDFEARRIPVDAWTHRAHLRVAFHYLSTRPYPQALAQLRDGIRRLNATHGKPDAYHETITVAYATVIHARVAADPVPRDSEAFLAANPDLTAGEALAPLSVHYSRERLMSPAARAGFLPPDRAPLPPTE
ncbi:MAG: response regulator transcription factor [Myxococcales bacterium]|nr:response regulator transcription factor [Myxococcales bacterium]